MNLYYFKKDNQILDVVNFWGLTSNRRGSTDSVDDEASEGVRNRQSIYWRREEVSIVGPVWCDERRAHIKRDSVKIN